MMHDRSIGLGPDANMNILMIGDDPLLAGEVDRVLRADGHTVRHLDDRARDLMMRKDDAYDVVLVDGALIELGRTSILNTLCEAGNVGPIVVLNRYTEQADRIDGVAFTDVTEGGGAPAFVALCESVSAVARRHAG